MLITSFCWLILEMQVDRAMAVFMPSKVSHAIDTNLLNVPSPEKIRNSSDLFLYVFVGADAFGLKSFMMKPYPTPKSVVE